MPGKNIKEFGIQETGKEYVPRRGGYAVIFKEKDEVGVIESPRGDNLPGGGKLKGEAIKKTVSRETLEESGLVVQVRSLLGVADELVYSQKENTHYRKRG